MSEQFKKDVENIKRFLSNIYLVNFEKDVKHYIGEGIFTADFETNGLAISCFYSLRENERIAYLILRSKEIFEIEKSDTIIDFEENVNRVFEEFKEKYKYQFINPEISVDEGTFTYSTDGMEYRIVVQGLYMSFELKCNVNSAKLTKTSIKSIIDLIDD